MRYFLVGPHSFPLYYQPTTLHLIIVILLYICTYFITKLGLGPVHPVYWIRLDGDTCLKVDICYHLNKFDTIKH